MGSRNCFNIGLLTKMTAHAIAFDLNPFWPSDTTVATTILASHDYAANVVGRVGKVIQGRQ